MFAQQLVNGLTLGAIYALIALGYTLVYGVLFFINFAHGDIYMVGAFVGLWLVMSGRFGFVPALLLGMLIPGLLGVVIERFAYRPLRKAPRLAPLLSALGVSILLENLFLKFQGPQIRSFPPNFFPSKLLDLRLFQISTFQVALLVIAVLLMVSLNLFIMKTRMGKAIRATSENQTAAALMGINTDRTISAVFLLGSMLAGAAGVLVGTYFNAVQPLMGWMPGMKGFIAAVLGGIGSIPGAMLGGLILGLSEIMIVGYVSSSLRDGISFVILIVILLWRPWGLIGKPFQTNV